MKSRTVALALVVGCCVLAAQPARPQCPATVPVAGAPLAAPLPVFPADNWWNVDVSSAPVDPGSAGYIAFINNGGTRRLHPDFGGEVSPGSTDIYGIPYAIVGGAQPKLPVTFDYWDESDGVDFATRQGIPFYPIPAQAITQPHWIEGGAPGNVDQRDDADRHLLMIDCTNNHLYELYNVHYNAAQARWYAGSGAFFDMNANGRRPDTWTSADAAGLAIFPGLVRYDDAWNPAVAEIGHAFRVTVRASNHYVYPASHHAGSTPGALPMGARLRLKALVGGLDPALRTSDPNMRKIFRAMQKHGLIVADNGSDLYITGTFDNRWNNDILNPAFALITASDFDVVTLGWKPPVAALPVLESISASPDAVIGPSVATGTVTLASAAPAAGAVIALASASGAVTVPANVTVGPGLSAATFAITSTRVTQKTATTLSATYNGATRTASFLVNPITLAPAVLATIALDRAGVPGGTIATGTVELTAAAGAAGAQVTLHSSNPSLAAVPESVMLPAGATTRTFAIVTAPTRRTRTATISATFAGVTKSATITVSKANGGQPRRTQAQ